MNQTSRTGWIPTWLARRPTGGDMIDLLAAAVAFAAIAGVVGRDLLTFAPSPAAMLAPMALTALFTPAFAEEAAFRGLLIHTGSRFRAAATLAISTVLFAAWHVVEAMTFLPGARSLFLRADFLTLAAILGLLCGMIRLRSGAIWTAVILHWLAVVAWKAAFGGPSLTSLAG